MGDRVMGVEDGPSRGMWGRVIQLPNFERN